MNNWFSTQISDHTLLTSSNNNVILPMLPTSPVTPITKMPQTNPPMLFLPKYS